MNESNASGDWQVTVPRGTHAVTLSIFCFQTVASCVHSRCSGKPDWRRKGNIRRENMEDRVLKRSIDQTSGTDLYPGNRWCTKAGRPSRHLDPVLPCCLCAVLREPETFTVIPSPSQALHSCFARATSRDRRGIATTWIFPTIWSLRGNKPSSAVITTGANSYALTSYELIRTHASFS